MHASNRIKSGRDTSPVLTITEAAAYLALGDTSIYRLIGSGELRSFVVGRSRRITRSACDELIAKREAEAA